MTPHWILAKQIVLLLIRGFFLRNSWTYRSCSTVLIVYYLHQLTYCCQTYFSIFLVYLFYFCYLFVSIRTNEMFAFEAGCHTTHWPWIPFTREFRVAFSLWCFFFYFPLLCVAMLQIMTYLCTKHTSVKQSGIRILQSCIEWSPQSGGSLADPRRSSFMFAWGSYCAVFKV